MILLAAVDWYAFFFMLFGALACVFAVAVLLTNNIVRMAFYLIISLGATAGLFFLAGAHFVGAMQIMIYVGGIFLINTFVRIVTVPPCSELSVRDKVFKGELAVRGAKAAAT